MEGTQGKFMFSVIKMVFHNKLVKLMLLKILIHFHALLFKNAKIVLLLQEVSQEIREIVGLNQNIMFGK